jgi:maltose/maltodextrin transport system substrate-binding protein
MNVKTVVMFAALLFFNTALAYDKDTLTIWVKADFSEAGIRQLAETFAKEKGIQVSVMTPEGSPDALFHQSVVLDRGPDIFIWPHDRIGEWVRAGFVANVTPNSRLQQQIPENLWNAVSYDNALYGYPIGVEGPTQICNKKLVDEPFKSFQDIVNADLPANVKPLLWDYGNAYFTYGVLSSEGGFAFERANGSYNPSVTGINNFGSRQGLIAIKDLIKTNLLPKGTDYGAMDAAFLNGTAACIINGPWAWSSYEAANIDFIVGPYPSVDGGQPAGFTGVVAAVIAKNTPNAALAKTFIEERLLTNAGLDTVTSVQSLGVVALGSYMEKLSAQNPRLKNAFDVWSVGEPMPNIPKMARFWTFAPPAITAVLNDDANIYDTLSEAAARITR